jgi:hypothetical protein
MTNSSENRNQDLTNKVLVTISIADASALESGQCPDLARGNNVSPGFPIVFRPAGNARRTGSSKADT